MPRIERRLDRTAPVDYSAFRSHDAGAGTETPHRS
jgi:hypothetical protein